MSLSAKMRAVRKSMSAPPFEFSMQTISSITHVSLGDRPDGTENAS